MTKIKNTMNILPENTQIYPAAHKMWAEGQCDEKASEIEVSAMLSAEGFEMSYFDTWYDSGLNCWQWNCTIKRYNP